MVGMRMLARSNHRVRGYIEWLRNTDDREHVVERSTCLGTESEEMAARRWTSLESRTMTALSYRLELVG